MAVVVSIDPRTGQAVEEVAPETSTEQVNRLAETARAAAPALEALGRAGPAQQRAHSHLLPAAHAGDHQQAGRRRPHDRQPHDR